MSLLSFAFAFVLSAAGDPASAADVEQAFLRQRSALVVGRLVLRGELRVDSPRMIREKWRSTIWWSGNKFRCDKSADNGDPATRRIYCEPCERDNHYVFFDAAKLQAGAKTFALHLQSLELPKGAARLGLELKFDPRIIGVSTSSFGHFHSTKLSSLFGRTDRSAPEIKKGAWKEKDAYLVA